MKTETKGAAEFAAGGKPIVCPHCGGTMFAAKSVLLNSRGLTFFNLDWANKSATVLTCVKCGRIEWFAEPPRQR